MLQGLRTVCYPVTDIIQGKHWYSQVLEQQPYFDEPFYVGFTVGGFELGLIPDGIPSTDGSMVYWGVTDMGAALERLVHLGATVLEDVHDVGGGIQTAAVRDPFGNRLGIIFNPQFKLEDVR